MDYYGEGGRDDELMTEKAEGPPQNYPWPLLGAFLMCVYK